MTFTPEIYVKTKLEDHIHVPPAKTPEWEIWALLDMGAELEESVAGIGDLSTVNVGTENAGKYIQVQSDGSLAYVTLPVELPTYSESDAGKVLSVNVDGTLIWKTIE